MKIENKTKFLIFFSLLIIIPLFVWGFFLRNSSTEEEILEEVVEEIDYPKFIGNENFSVEALGVFSFYYDKETEKILYEKNADKELPIASISKIMTANVVFESYNLDESLRVTEREVTSKTEFRDFRAWSDTKIGDVLSQMIIESNNSGAFALALISNRYLNYSEEPIENFVKAMNMTAKEIGLSKTNFINPSGLDSIDNYNQSTAKEVALIAKYTIEQNSEIFEISKKPSFRLFSPDKTVYYDAITTNVFLSNQKKDWTEKIYGGKTGWTRAADGCLLIVLEVPEKKGYIINVVLGAKDRFLEMEKLINFIYESYLF
jgi:serine-type D-Ala-D-Ala carboxypeptidase (penicillin-binding protein 5/6)